MTSETWLTVADLPAGSLTVKILGASMRRWLTPPNRVNQTAVLQLEGLAPLACTHGHLRELGLVFGKKPLKEWPGTAITLSVETDRRDGSFRIRISRPQT